MKLALKKALKSLTEAREEGVNLLMGRQWLIGVLLLSLVCVCSYVSGVHITMAVQLLETKLIFSVPTET